jgi:phage gp46-like protein
MAQNLQIDPASRDYVVVNGSPVPSDRVEEAAYIAMTIPRGLWLHGDPGQGSELWRFQKVKRTSAIEQQFAERTKDAIITQLIAQGKAKAVAVGNIDNWRTGTSNKVQIIPAAAALSSQLAFEPV